MEDRIEINGVWYIREDLVESSESNSDLEITDFLGSVCETDDYSWEASKIYRDIESNEFYNDDINIKFYDKKLKEEEYWDNCQWMRNLLNGDKETIDTARKNMSMKGVQDFIKFLKILKKRGWF